MATVSLALRGLGSISDETALRVREVADGLGYRKNWPAKALARGQLDYIVFSFPLRGGETRVHPSLMDVVPIADVTAGVVRATQRSGYIPHLSVSSEQIAEDIIRSSAGVIVGLPPLDDPLVSQAQENDIPIVTFGPMPSGGNLDRPPFVAGAFRESVFALLETLPTTVGKLLILRSAQSPTSDALREVLKEWQATRTVEVEVRAVPDNLSSANGFEALLSVQAEEGELPEAVLAVSSMLALGVSRALDWMQVGDSEVRILSLTDSSLLDTESRPITSARHDFLGAGERAALMLSELIDSPGLALEPWTMPFELVERG